MVKIKLPFVNNGKPFEVGIWTTEKHEKALTMMLNDLKNATDEERTKQFKYYVILIGLQEVDSKVTLKQVKNLHVENIADLFNLIYNAGKLEIFEEDFREGENPPKSTGKKS